MIIYGKELARLDLEFQRKVTQNPHHIHPEYRAVHKKAETIIAVTGNAVHYQQAYQETKVDNKSLPEHVFDGQKTYPSIVDLESSLYETYQLIAPVTKLQSTLHQHDLSRILTGDGIIEFLIYEEGFELASTYVDALHERVGKEETNVYPLSADNIQKRITTRRATKDFMAAYEVHQDSKTQQSLATLFKKIPRLSRAYTALLAWELDKQTPSSMTPFYRYGWETLKTQIDASGKKTSNWKAKDPVPKTWDETKFVESEVLLLNNPQNDKLRKSLSDLRKNPSIFSKYLKHLAHVEVSKNLYQERFIALGIKEAKKWYTELGSPDANGAAIDGIHKALRRFDYDRGFRFPTFATWWIKQKLQREHDTSDEIKIPVFMKERMRKIKYATQELALQGVHEPTNIMIAEILDWDSETVESTIQFRRNSKLVHIDKQVKNNNGNTSNISDFLEDENSPKPSDRRNFTDKNDMVTELFNYMRQPGMHSLTEREEYVIKTRYGIDLPDGKGKSLSEIGKHYELTRERIRQIEVKALRKIRFKCRSNPKLRRNLISIIR